MGHKIRRSIHLLITESWTVVWGDEAMPSLGEEPGSHVIAWDEEQPAPDKIVLRRKADGAGWWVESGQ